MDQSTPAPLSPGARLGPYEITGALGAGGMGEVFRAKDTRLGRDVAVKVLPTSFAVDPDRRRRFEQEARAVAALNHPNVLVVHDVGTHEGRSWIVTELLEGETLREKLCEGRLPPRKAVDVAIQVARGLSAAHEKGIVHRDLKPENVFLTRDGRAKILDFGLARVDLLSLDREAETQATPREATSPGMLLGTVAYMSPEQARGRPADTRSDVFALGAVLFEMLAGQRPFGGATPADTLSAILREDPPPIETGSGVVPPTLDRVVRRCLEKEPDERFQTARDVGFALEALSQATDSTTSGTAVPTGAPGWRRVTSRSLVGAVALVALGAGAAVGVRSLLVSPPAPRIVGYRPLTGGSFGRVNMAATEGERAYFAIGGATQTRQVSLSGGASSPLEVPFRLGGVLDASRARSSLLMLGHDEPSVAVNSWEWPLWSVPIPAGGARRLGLDAFHAAWSPDGERLAFVKYMLPSRLSVARGDGSDAKVLLESPDHLTWVAWSPDGSRLRFSSEDAGTLQHWIWEIPAAGGEARRLFPGFFGTWSPDGRAFVFSRGGPSAGWGWSAGAGAESRLNLFAALEQPWWRLGSTPRIEPMTFGPLHMSFPRFTRDGRHIVARGTDSRARLMRFDAGAARFSPLLGGLPGGFLDYSRDGQWIAWVDIHELSLWRSRADGTSPVQLTTPPLAVGLVRWSPDGRRLAFVGKPPESLPRIYVVARDGGQPEPLSEPEKGQVWDPCWLPDGKTVIWGRIDGGGFRAFDLETRKSTVLPHTDDLWYPKCSSQGLLLGVKGGAGAGAGGFWTHDPRTGRRDDLALPGVLSYPNFTRDGQWVIGYSGGDRAIFRFGLHERRFQRMADLGPLEVGAPLFAQSWMTLDPEDAPIFLQDTSTHEIYALDLEWP